MRREKKANLRHETRYTSSKSNMCPAPSRKDARKGETLRSRYWCNVAICLVDPHPMYTHRDKVPGFCWTHCAVSKTAYFPRHLKLSPSLPPLSFAPTIQPHRASSRVRRSRPLMITYQTLHHHISPWIVALLLAGRRSGCPAGCITHQTISPSSANLFSLSHKKATEPVQAVGLCLAKAVRS